MSQLNVAVIGCGSWGVNHARVYSDLPMVRLAAVSDIDAKRVQKCSRKHSANGFTDTLKVLEDPDIDAVSFCTPTCTHSHIAEKALLNDKHVLVEKPMTDTVDEAQGLIELAEDVGLNLTVGFVERFNPAVRLSKRLIDDGEIGRVIMAHAKRVTRRPDRVGDIGVIKDLGIHDIDVITHLMGEPPETVYATAGSHMHTFEDYANITLEYRGNRSAFIETNWLTPKRVRSLTITGSDGIIGVEYTTQELRVEKNDYIHQPLNGYREPLYLELLEFTSSIMEDRKPEVTGLDGLRALEICEAALESAKTGRVVEMS